MDTGVSDANGGAGLEGLTVREVGRSLLDLFELLELE